MVIRELNRGEAQKAMDEWKSIYPSLPQIDDSYTALREYIQNENSRIRKNSPKNSDDKYFIDSQLGFSLYKYLWENFPNFSMRVAANDGFWRYLSLKVAPDVVSQRWGKESDDHFWSKPTRIWFRSIWWYVHLSWQGDYEATAKMLGTDLFTTDTILNFVERTGRYGTNIDVYREIIRIYSQLNSKTTKNGEDLFRVVMKLNTAKMMVMEPALCEGGVLSYALSLFKDIGIQSKYDQTK